MGGSRSRGTAAAHIQKGFHIHNSPKGACLPTTSGYLRLLGEAVLADKPNRPPEHKYTPHMQSSADPHNVDFVVVTFHS